MTCESVACRSYFTNKSVRDVCALRDLWYLWAMCVRASMKAAKPLHIVLATNPNPTRARGYPLNINPKPDPKPDSISGPAGSGRVADLYAAFTRAIEDCMLPAQNNIWQDRIVCFFLRWETFYFISYENTNRIMTLTLNLSTYHLTADTESELHVFLRHSLLKLHLTEVSTAFMHVF